MTDLLKQSAEWLGYESRIEYDDTGNYLMVLDNSDISVWRLFNPNEETGRHWLVMMEKKLNHKQRVKYIDKLIDACPDEVADMDVGRIMWFKTAESKLCFKTICQVLNFKGKL